MLDEDPSPEDIERFGGDTGTCPECGEEVWDQAGVCPRCGSILADGPVARRSGLSRRWMVVVALIALLALAIAILSRW